MTPMNNVDAQGFPGTQGDDGQFDGGDTAAIVGNLIALGQAEIFPVKLRLMRSFLIRDDGLVRHPDRSKWWGQTDRFSRDQLIPILCSFVGEIPVLEVRNTFRFHQANYFLQAWNTRGNGQMDMPAKTADFTGPEIWALWYRVRGGPWWLGLLLPLLDLETLLGAITWRFQPATNRVCRNHMLVCLTGMKKNPTITMRLACWVNDWADLLARWRAHVMAVQEYPTADLFARAVAALRSR
jgi:hypothetical protein